MDDPFALLGVARTFACDKGALEKRHRELSRALHPDRFVNAPPGERREALARAVEVNEAYRVLRDPIRRAEALFRLAGVPVGEANEPKATPMFLMDVMEQREALAEAKARKDVTAVRRLAEGMEERMEAAEAALSQAFAQESPSREAVAPWVSKLGELRFYKRFLDEVSAIEDDLAHG